MKKVFMLFLSFVLVAVSSAQYNPGNEDGYGKKRNAEYSERFKKDNDGRWRKNHNWKKERDMEIEQIDREYNRKIQDVQNRRFISRHKKQRLIRELEEQRRNEIESVYERYRGRNRKQSYYDNDRNW